VTGAPKAAVTGAHIRPRPMMEALARRFTPSGALSRSGHDSEVPLEDPALERKEPLEQDLVGRVQPERPCRRVGPQAVCQPSSERTERDRAGEIADN
jgi:hypothetical protein